MVIRRPSQPYPDPHSTTATKTVLLMKVSALGATEGEATHRIIYFGRDVRKITGVFSVTLATLFDIRCGAFVLVVRVNAGD